MAVLEAAVADARRAGADGFVFLGDIFEGKPHPREYGDFIAIMMELAKDSLVWIVRGNHEDYEAYTFFEGLSQMIRVAWDEIVVSPVAGLRLLLVPYPTRGRAPFHDLENDDGTIMGSMRAASQRIRRKIQEADPQPLPLIVLGHFTIEGMTTRDAEFEQHHANEVVVPVDVFGPAALTFVGHVHRAQELGNGRIIGVGDLYRTSFAEIDDPKSYVLLDTDTLTWERRPTLAREQLDLTVELNDLSTAWIDDVVRRAKGKEVKIRVGMEAEQAPRFDPRVFEPIGAVAAYMPLPERVVRPKQRVRAPEVNRVMTIGDQLVAWMRATDQPTDQERMDRLFAKLEEI